MNIPAHISSICFWEFPCVLHQEVKLLDCGVLVSTSLGTVNLLFKIVAETCTLAGYKHYFYYFREYSWIFKMYTPMLVFGRLSLGLPLFPDLYLYKLFDPSFSHPSDIQSNSPQSSSGLFAFRLLSFCDRHKLLSCSSHCYCYFLCSMESIHCACKLFHPWYKLCIMTRSFSW